MFRCAVCGELSKPKEKPIRVVTGTRRVSYHNEFQVEDEWGNKRKQEVDSEGDEIEGEILVCKADAKHYGVELTNQPRNSVIILGAHTFEEPLVPQLHRPLIDVAVHNTLHHRLEHKSKRADKDNRTSIPLVKFFTDHNPKFKF